MSAVALAGIFVTLAALIGTLSERPFHPLHLAAVASAGFDLVPGVGRRTHASTVSAVQTLMYTPINASTPMVLA